MSAFGPIDYLRARDLAYQAGAAQGRKGSLGAALGLWQAPTVQDPYQHEPALIAQQKAQERAQQAAGVERQEQLADEQRAFGRNVVLEQLRQTGRGELQGERLAQQRDVFGEREARLRETQAATLAAQGAAAEEKRRTDEEKRRTAYAKWLHTTPGQAATKAQGREWAMALPYPLRTAALATLGQEEYAAEQKKQGEAEAKAEALYEERLERDLGRVRQRAEEGQARAVAAAEETAAEASQKRLRAYTGILRDLKRDRDKPLHRGASKYRGWSDDQLEDEALAILERGEQRTAPAGAY